MDLSVLIGVGRDDVDIKADPAVSPARQEKGPASTWLVGPLFRSSTRQGIRSAGVAVWAR